MLFVVRAQVAGRGTTSSGAVPPRMAAFPFGKLAWMREKDTEIGVVWIF